MFQCLSRTAEGWVGAKREGRRQRRVNRKPSLVHLAFSPAKERKGVFSTERYLYFSKTMNTAARTYRQSSETYQQTSRLKVLF